MPRTGSSVVLYLLLTADMFLSIIWFRIEDFPAFGAPRIQTSKCLEPKGDSIYLRST